jgi:hypothetical protein
MPRHTIRGAKAVIYYNVSQFMIHLIFAMKNEILKQQQVSVISRIFWQEPVGLA